MANIRITCPTCKTELEVDSTFEGQEVECGNCFQTFVARSPRPQGIDPGKIPGAGFSDRGRRNHEDDDDRLTRSSRLRDEYDDDDNYYAPPTRSASGGSGLAVASMILGILAVFPGCCCGLFGLPLSIGAIITGALALKQPNGKPLAIVGIVLGVLMLALMIVGTIANIGMNLNNPGRFR